MGLCKKISEIKFNTYIIATLRVFSSENLLAEVGITKERLNLTLSNIQK